MKGDFSRHTFDASKHYTRVLMQQGRVQLDADWNEQQAINLHRIETEAIDVIGRCGGPIDDAGFEITIQGVQVDGNDGDAGKLVIGKGRYYVHGNLCENEAQVASDEQPDLPDTADILKQLDELEATAALVYLDVWPRHITALDDPLIRETALGGPDTATRAKAIWQVKFLAVDTPPAIDCDSQLEAWNELIAATSSKLNARTRPVSKPNNDCKLAPQAGYKLLENQHYRVEIHGGHDPDKPDQPATFKWSRDNGTVVSAIEKLDGKVITVRDVGQDDVLCFANGQWVELIDDRTELKGQPGQLLQIDVVDSATREITLKAEPINDGLNINPKLRRWDQSGEIATKHGVAIAPDWIELEGDIQVKFSGDKLKTGEYWLIPARTATGEIEWPPFEVPNINPNPQSPLGIQHYYCKLAVLKKTKSGWIANDCRQLFPPLTALDQKPDRIKSCCTHTVGDGILSLGEFTKIQDAIDALSEDGGKICILPGEYRENVKIDSLKKVTLSGCGQRSKIVSDNIAPALYVVNSRNIRIEHLAVEAHTEGIGILLDGNFRQIDLEDAKQQGISPSANIALVDLMVTAGSHSAIEADDGEGILVQGCRVEMNDVPGESAAVFLVGEDILVENNVITVLGKQPNTAGQTGVHAGRGGLQIGGGAERVRVINNLIQSGMGNGITLGSFREVKEKSDGSLFGTVMRAWVVDAGEPCGPCLAGSSFVPNPTRVGDIRTRFQSAAPIDDLIIQGNRILDMGLNGIGVAGYFDIIQNPELITVSNLAILNNEIRGCLQRPLKQRTVEMSESMGYGGIALANVQDALLIRENTIEDNGPEDIYPICGIFVLLGEGIDISSNRIVNNGAKTGQPSLLGARGGIYVANCLAPTVPVQLGSGVVDNQLVSVLGTNSLDRQNGVPALRVHDNIVSSPLGQALHARALGPVSVQGNQFTSRGIVANVASPTFLAATVGILNLGVSNEFYLQLLFSALRNKKLAGGRLPVVNTDTIGQPGLGPNQLGRIAANGNVLFCNNQCVLDLLEAEVSVSVSSIAILTLDDIGFHGNQCDCSMLVDFVLAQAILIGMSVRASDNRFKESLFGAIWSLVSLALLLNTTTDNQSTRCLLVRGFLSEFMEHNLVFIDAVTNGEFCNALNGKVLDQITRGQL